MRAGKLLVQVTAYYLVIALVIFVALRLWPGLRDYLPVGGVEQAPDDVAEDPPERGGERERTALHVRVHTHDHFHEVHTGAEARDVQVARPRAGEIAEVAFGNAGAQRIA